jgi:hypothetical protein
MLFPQQQFNATEDRRAELPSQGAACFDCHSNGHQNDATHLAPDTRPQQFRHCIKTISLRGLKLFGSQRDLGIDDRHRGSASIANRFRYATDRTSRLQHR